MIFVDTSAIYALADHRDMNHLDAAHRFDALLQSRRRLFTHSYVLVESMALLDRRLGRDAMFAFASEVRAFEIEWVGMSLHGRAVDALQDAGRTVSLVDQVSFLVMRAHGIDEAFAFDRHFTSAGFRLYEA